MLIFPAIDIINGKAVRLTKGEYDSVKTYSDMPTEVAKGFFEKGAKCLHLVDLDGAKTGQTDNFSTVEQIVKSTSAFVEIGGGVRDEERIERYLGVGVGRVILGTVAIKNPSLLKSAVKKYGSKIAVGVDVKNGYVATDGWLALSGQKGVELVRNLRNEGVETVIYTDIARDGMLQGTNMNAYEELSKIDGINIMASGGITTLEEVEKLKNMNIYGAILGKAIYENRISLSDALMVARSEKIC